MFEGGTSEEEMMRADVIAAEVQTNFITYSNDSIMVFVAWEHLTFLNVRLLTYFVLSIKGCNF